MATVSVLATWGSKEATLPHPANDTLFNYKSTNVLDSFFLIINK